MQLLLDDRQTAVAMGRAGRRQIETINGPAAHYEQTLAAYRALLPGSFLEEQSPAKEASTL
jgi:hypothetical protein